MCVLLFYLFLSACWWGFATVAGGNDRLEACGLEHLQDSKGSCVGPPAQSLNRLGGSRGPASLILVITKTARAAAAWWTHTDPQLRLTDAEAEGGRGEGGGGGSDREMKRRS